MTCPARLAPVALAAGLALVALPAEAASFSPPVAAHEQASVEEAEPRVLAPDLFRGPRALEWTATVLGGSYRGPLPYNGAGTLHLGVGVGYPNFVMGLRVSLDGMGEGMGYGIGLQLGPRFRLDDAVRLELVADGGVESYSVDYDADIILASGKATGSSRTLPSAGLRTGLMVLRSDGGFAVTFGAMFRWVRPATVVYQSTACVVVALCASDSRTTSYGGNMVGAYLTFTSLRPLGS
jgi:hypothetical protein